jgi:hypothetical protein
MAMISERALDSARLAARLPPVVDCDVLRVLGMGVSEGEGRRDARRGTGSRQGTCRAPAGTKAASRLRKERA